MYTKLVSCFACARMIVKVDIERVVAEKDYHDSALTKQFFKQAGVKLVILTDEVEEYSNQKQRALLAQQTELNRKSKYPSFDLGRIMKWQICITLASLPLAYPILLLGYYVGKYLRETNPKEIVRGNKELF